MLDHRGAWGLHRSAIIGWMLLAMLAAAAPAPAQTIDAFEVRKVDVDVTAETAAKAREQALADGERAAFERLLRRLTLRSVHDRIPKLPAAEIATYVKDFDVASEKTAPDRYLARLNYRFKADDIRGLLRDYGFAFAETPSKPVLVLPVYQAAAARLLWDDPNPWREAWAARPKTDSLVPLILPLGDLADIGAIGAEQALAGDPQRLKAVARRYNAGNTIVAHGTLALDSASGVSVLEVVAARHGGARDDAAIVRSFIAADGESDDGLLRRAAAAIAVDIEDNWKLNNLLRFGRGAVMAVTVPIGGLGDWLKVRGRLGGVAVIGHTDLVLLSRDEVRLNLHYIGESDQLAVALEQADLFLTRDEHEWFLGLTRAPAGATP
jgi:hypothetical protein